MDGIEKITTNSLNKIKHLICVSSGKGGVGKSYVTSVIASKLNKLGYKVGIIDGDIVGPSIPRAFNLKDKLEGDPNGLIFPSITKEGIKIVSSNLLISKEDDPIVWRSQLTTSLLLQFYKDVFWGELDFLLIDMPPGTSDITLTAYQSLNVDGVLIVSTPQDLVKLIVTKSIKMAKLLNIPILGLIENMSYVVCPDCNKKINLFVESRLKDIAKENNINTFTSLPLSSINLELIEKGKVTEINENNLDIIIEELRKL